MTKAVALLSLVVVLAASPAQDPCPGQRVRVTLVIILASEQGDTVDEKLTAIADEVRIKNPNLKSFHLKSMATRSLAPNEKTIIELVDNKSVAITVKHGADKEKWISLAVTAPDQGEIVYRSVCDKFLPIVTRYRTKNKERLILAIRVQPCKGE